MTKVCHLSSAHKNNDTRIFHKQCVSLAKAGYETCFVVRGESMERDGVRIVGVPIEGGSRLKRMLFAARTVYQKGLELDADIYEFHDPELLPYGLKLKKRGKRVIFDSHEDYPTQILEKDWIPGPLRRLISKAYRAYETHVVKQLDAVFFPCTKNGVNIFEGRAKETVILSNAVLMSEIPQELPKTKQPDRVCCTGSLTYQRGITHLIKGAYLAGVKLVLAGNYSSQDYQKELEAMPEYACVEYKGYLNREELAEVYRQSSVGMSTILNVGQYSSLDNFPTKVYEYMAAGLPVIASDYPFLRKAAEEDGFGICVAPDRPEEIAGAIKEILSSPERAAEMGRRGRQAVMEKYNWNIEEKKMLQLYQKLSR